MPDQPSNPDDEPFDPVPITVWHVPAPAPGAVAAGPLIRRLTVNYSPRGGAVLDLTAALGRQGAALAQPLHLVITCHPDPRPSEQDQVAVMAARLRPGGCLAVVVPNAQIPDALGALVASARAAGLTYLQHIVAAHHLAPRDDDLGEGRRRRRPPSAERHLRVHTDVLVFRKPEDADD